TGKDAVRENAGRKKQSDHDWINDAETKMKNRSDVLYRARKQVFNQANANANAWNEQPKFFTLTYAENMQDIKQSNYNFKKFIQRLNYTLKIKLKYTAVIEFQKRGAIHYHLLVYNLPYTPVDVLSDIWGHGFVKINKIDHVDNVGAYITKYMIKDNIDERLLGEKSYFSSRGLKKPEEYILTEKEKETLLKSHDEYITYSKNYENEYLGNIHKIQINLNRKS
ncbi:rolling circle replication-associated protein, partial [Lysinibacillus fusiformis]